MVFAGAGICLLAGFLIGVVAGPDSPSASEGVVSSYDPRTRKLCVQGDQVAELPGSDGDVLCGTWNKGAGSVGPQVGDTFRFLTLQTDSDPGDDQPGGVLIYGDVVD